METDKPETVPTLADQATNPLTAHPCLNCGTALQGAFYAVCGQAASTHRYSVKSFLTHDLLHSFFHVDKSIFKTLREVLLRPGFAARENISGRRVKYFPILTLLLLVLAVYLGVLQNSFEAHQGGVFQLGNWDLSEIVTHYQKWLMLATIPLLALVRWWVFKRSKYNYAEQLVVGSFAAACIYAWLCALDYFFTLDSNIITKALFCFFILLYGLIYWQAFRHCYSIVGWAWRFVAYLLLTTLLLFAVIIIITIVAKDKTGADLG